MATPQMAFTWRKVKAGVLCTARVTLECGHDLREDAQGRTEATAKTATTRLMMSRTKAHVEDCKG